MFFSEKDKAVVRSLACRYSEIAFSPENERSVQLAYNANDLKGGRPFVAVDELPWVELETDSELSLECENDFARGAERFFRREIYCFRHFPTNRIFRKYYAVGKSFDREGWGVGEQADILETEKGNNIVSHRYHDIFKNEEDIFKIKPITVTPRPDVDECNMNMALDLLGDSFDVRLTGQGYIYLAPWDQIVRMHTVENTFMDFYDRPEFMHALMQRYVDIQTDFLEQLEKYNLLDSHDVLTSLHCTAPFTSKLSHSGDKTCFGLKDIWIRCTAQSLGSCSPEMYNEFEIEHMASLFSRFGAVYYGCCEPLERVIPYLRKYPNMRKVGCSPFADVESCAEQVGKDYTLSRKPNPSFLSGGFSEDIIRKEITETAEICNKYGCSYDYVLKDISTVGHCPERLSIWAKTVNNVLDSVYGN